MSNAIEALLKRVEEASGPDRQLDADLYDGVIGLKMYQSIYERGGNLCIREYADPTGPSYYNLPRFTASIDAALGLVERVLPGSGVGFLPGWSEGRYGGVITPAPRKTVDLVRDTIAPGNTPPLAILAALLKALASTERKGDTRDTPSPTGVL